MYLFLKDIYSPVTSFLPALDSKRPAADIKINIQTSSTRRTTHATQSLLGLIKDSPQVIAQLPLLPLVSLAAMQRCLSAWL